jgi:hypothetical protein
LDRIFLPVLQSLQQNVKPTVIDKAVKLSRDSARRHRALTVMSSSLPKCVDHFWNHSRYRTFGDGGANLMFKHNNQL